MGVNLKYDIETITSIKKKLVEMDAEITELSSNLDSTFQELKGKWNTEASKDFFETVDGDWADGVKAASGVLNDLIDALDDVISEYSLIETEAKTRFN